MLAELEYLWSSRTLKYLVLDAGHVTEGPSEKEDHSTIVKGFFQNLSDGSLVAFVNSCQNPLLVWNNQYWEIRVGSLRDDSTSLVRSVLASLGLRRSKIQLDVQTSGGEWLHIEDDASNQRYQHLQDYQEEESHIFYLIANFFKARELEQHLRKKRNS